MKNEFGVDLDRNGYAPSIMGVNGYCFLCFRTGPFQRHEVFHGANRQKSKKYGLWINVCPECHHKIHFADGKVDRLLKENGQRQACMVYKWSKADFIKRFGKSYVE